MKEALVDPLTILLPPLHIKLGIMKALPKDGLCFMYLCDQFKYLSDAKIKEAIFVAPLIRKLKYKMKNLEKSRIKPKRTFGSHLKR